MNCTLVCVDVYTVEEGDTLYSIAERYDLPVSLLMKVNCITNPYNLQIGTKLCIPGDISELPSCDQENPVEEEKPEPKYHIVESGDTLYLIAKKYSLKLDNLMEANPDIDPYNMMIGTKLNIPAE